MKITGGGLHSKLLGESRDKVDAAHEEIKVPNDRTTVHFVPGMIERPSTLYQE